MGRHRSLAAAAVFLSLLFTLRPVQAESGIISGAYWTVTVVDDFNALVVADLNHDGWDEILGGTDEGRVVAWTAGGHPIWEFQVETDWVSSISIADLDGDGSDEVLVIAAGILPTSYLYVLRADGSPWWSHSVRDELWAVLPLDLDDDSAQELLLAARRSIVLDSNGEEIPDWPVESLRTPLVCLADWDGDAIQDVVTITPDSLNILRADGTSQSLPLALGEDIKAIESGNFDGDDAIELVVLTDTVLVLVDNDGGIQWTSPLHDAARALRTINNPTEMSRTSLFALSNMSGIEILDANGDERWSFDTRLPNSQISALTAYENLILAGTTSGQAYMFDGEGHQRAEYDLATPISHAVIDDLNGDGHQEVIFTSGGTINVFGMPADGTEIRDHWRYTAHAPVVSLESGDVDGDIRAEILLSERDGRITMLDRKGTVVWQHVQGDPLDGWVQDGFGGFLTWTGASFHRHNNQGAILWESLASGKIRTITPVFGGFALLTEPGQITLRSFKGGNPIWSANLGSPVEDLAATEAGLVVSLEGTIQLLDTSGVSLWQTRVNQPIRDILSIPGGGVLVRSLGQLSWLNADGIILWGWEAQPAERIISVDISRDLVAVGTDARALALDRDGVEVWSQSFDEVINAVAILDLDADGVEETAVGTVNGSVVLLSSDGAEVWRDRGRERVNVLTSADLNADGLPEIIAGFEDGVVTAYGLALDQPPWLGEPAVAAVGDGYQYAVQVRDPDFDPVRVTLEIWDPSACTWVSLGSATAPTGEGTLTWNVPNPFDTWDSRKDSAFHFKWEEEQETGTTAASPGPLRIPVPPWYVTYGRMAGLIVLILATPILLAMIIRRTRSHRNSPLGQAEAALLRLRLDSNETILEVRQLLSDEPRALVLLDHLPGLAREAGETSLGDLLEGSHMAMTRPEVMVEALRTITDALAQFEKLPQSEELRQFYSLLLEALTITTTSQIAELRGALGEMGENLSIKGIIQVPAEATLNRLASVTRTLHASKQVEATSDRISYLAEALADLGEIDRYIKEESASLERHAMIAVIHHWLGLISDTLEKLRGRAEIELRLRTRQLVLRKEVVLGITLTNTGRNPATDLAVEVITKEGFLLSKQRTLINVLSAGANRQLDLALQTTDKVGSFEITFRITWDDRERAGKVASFTDHVRLIPKPSQFQPIPNPYATGRPLVPGSPVFVGREDIFTFVKDKIVGGHIVVLVGERRTGKTSLLRQLSSYMGDAWFVTYLDGQGLGIEGGLEHWLADAALEISRATGNLTIPSSAELGSQPGPIFEDYLRKVVIELDQGQRLLLLFDEFEEIEVRVRDGTLPSSIFPYLRHLMQLENIGFLLAGTKRLERLSPEYWTPLFNIGLYQEIGPLDDASARKLIHEPVEGRLLYDDLAVDKLLRLSGRQPYFLQLLCHTLVAQCNRDRIAYVTLADIGSAEEEASRLGQAHLRFLWEGASSEGQAVLKSLSWLITMGEPGTVEEISTGLKSLGHTHEKSSRLIETLVQLTNLGLVNRSNDGRYHFSADLLRSWIQRTKMS